MRSAVNTGLLKRSPMMLLLCFMCACSESGYYVSPDGDDGNPGTRTKPFKTIAKVNTLTLKPGDMIFFKGGEIFEGTLDLTLPGTSHDSVIVSTYGEGSATINGRTKEAVTLTGKYFRVERIHATGAGRKTGSATNGIELKNASYGLLRDVRAEGFQKSGIDLSNCSNIVVDRVLAVNNGFSGIHVRGVDMRRSRNIVIRNSQAANNPGDPTNLDNHSGNGILIATSDSILVDHCVATNNGWDMPRIGNGPVGIWAYESNQVIFQYCISYENKTSTGAKDGGGFDFDGGVTNSVMQYCLSYGNAGAGYGLFQYDGASVWHNNVVRYCVSINDAMTTEGSGAIFIWNGTEDSVQLADCFVHNNLVYATAAPAIQFEPQSLNRNFHFYNNIFIGKGDIIHGPTSGERFVGNVWWNASGSQISFRGYESLQEWSAVTGQERLAGAMRGRQIDPLLKGPLTATVTDPYELDLLVSYMLSARSPLIDSGMTIDPVNHIPGVLHDFFGTPVPQGPHPEPGVFEWNEDR